MSCCDVIDEEEDESDCVGVFICTRNNDNTQLSHTAVAPSNICDEPEITMMSKLNQKNECMQYLGLVIEECMCVADSTERKPDSSCVLPGFVLILQSFEWIGLRLIGVTRHRSNTRYFCRNQSN